MFEKENHIMYLKKKVPGSPGKSRDKEPEPIEPEGPGTKKSQDLKSPKVLGLENGKVPEKMTSLMCVYYFLENLLPCAIILYCLFIR